LIAQQPWAYRPIRLTVALGDLATDLDDRARIGEGATITDDKVIEAVYGKCQKFTVISKGAFLGSVEFLIRRDDRPHKSPCRSLDAAVNATRKEG